MNGHLLFLVLLAMTDIGTVSGQVTSRRDIPVLPPGSLQEALPGTATNPYVTDDIGAELSKHAYVEAEDELLGRISKSATPKGLLEVLAGVYFLDSKYLQSAIAFKKAEKYGELTSRDQFTLAMDYVKLNRSDWARDQLTTLSRAKPGDPLYLYWLGRLDYDGQQFAGAKANFERAIKADSSFARAYDGIALCEEAMGETARAEENYRRATVLNREQGNPSAWPPLNYGSLLRKTNRFSEAKGLLEEAVSIDPALSKAYYELGRVEESLSNRQAAIEDLKKACSLDPTDSSSVYALYRLYKQSGQRELASAMMARFRRLKPQ